MGSIGKQNIVSAVMLGQQADFKVYFRLLRRRCSRSSQSCKISSACTAFDVAYQENKMKGVVVSYVKLFLPDIVDVCFTGAVFIEDQKM